MMAASATTQPPAVQTPQSHAPVAVQQTTAAAMTGQTAAVRGFTNASLYVGDLDTNVVEQQLYDLFGRIGQVVSIRVCRDQDRGSLGYAYVNYANPQDAATALEVLNFTPLNGKPIRIMYSHRDPSIRKSGYANVFIKNLDPSIDNKALLDTFAAFGTVLSCKIALDNTGQPKGYGFVQFDKEEAAQNAIQRLNGMLINDKKVYVGFFVRHQERNQGNGVPKFTNVYVKNLCEATTEDDLKIIFGKFGSITSVIVMRDGSGTSKCFGFVNFQSSDSAAAAVEHLNGATFNDKVWYVGKAQRKSERESELRAKFEQERKNKFEKFKDSNLYLKNLDDSINDEKLKELFSEFGTITSCKVMLDSQGLSKGSGFVAFSTPEEATKALNVMNGTMIGRKPLYVAVAQRKEERKVFLQAQFAQGRGAISPLQSGVSGFHPGSPATRLSPQQVYYGQGTPGLIPTQPAGGGYGYQQQLIPGMRPAVGPNFVMPFQLSRQGQPGQRLGGGGGLRRGGHSQQMQHQQQPVLLHRNSNQSYRYIGNGRNGIDPQMVPQGLMGPLMQYPFDVSGMPMTPPIDIQRNGSAAVGQLPISTLASALASTTPDNQLVMLGEQLYPLVERIERESAGKVTGMLLEMDQTEVLHLIESPDALKKKVAEAMEVLRASSSSSGNDVRDQLGSMNLNE